MRSELQAEMSGFCETLIMCAIGLIGQLPLLPPERIGDSEAAEWNIPDPDPGNIEALRAKLKDTLARKATFDLRASGPFFEEAQRLRPSYYVGLTRTLTALYYAQTLAGAPDPAILQQAQQAATEAMRYTPAQTGTQLATAFMELACALEKQGRVEDAIRWMKAEVQWTRQLRPSSGGSLVHLAVLQMRVGRNADAVRNLQKALRTDQRGLGIFQLLLWLQLRTGDEVGARTTAREGLLFVLGEIVKIVELAQTTRVFRAPKGSDAYPPHKWVPKDDVDTIRLLLEDGWEEVSLRAWQRDLTRLRRAAAQMFEAWRGRWAQGRPAQKRTE